jgi:lipopolysaccharide/colanic/teichoic acid biosynthesis glycosyltransferase
MSLPSNRLMWGGLVEVSSEAGLEPATLAPADRWLRHTGLDELPQLALIVTGRMRLVGPRPATFGELEQMVCIAARDPRCAVGVDSLAPGVVGVWQVLERHGYSLAERQALDRFMIDHWSPALQRAIVAMASGQAVRRLVGRS